MTTHNPHTIRNLIIFTVLIIVLGWTGWGIGVMGGTTDSQGLGMLIWLLSPLVACIVLRLFGGDGWQDLGLKPAFKGNGLGYALSVLIYPLATLVIVLLGAVFGSVTLDFGAGKAAAFVPTLLGALVFNTVLTGGYVSVSPAAELVFTPGMHGILSMVIIVVIGLWLYRRRTGKTS